MSEFPETLVKIYDWNVWRVFRDNSQNILKIVLEKDGLYRAFAFEDQDDKRVGDERVK